MDSSLLSSIIIAIVAIVPGVWALVNQAKKDKVQANIDMANAAQNAAVSIIQPLRDEVARLQARVKELEDMLAEKNDLITKLEESVYERDSKIRTLSSDLDTMKLRLDRLAKATDSDHPDSSPKTEPTPKKGSRKPPKKSDTIVSAEATEISKESNQEQGE